MNAKRQRNKSIEMTVGVQWHEGFDLFGNKGKFKSFKITGLPLITLNYSDNKMYAYKMTGKQYQKWLIEYYSEDSQEEKTRQLNEMYFEGLCDTCNSSITDCYLLMTKVGQPYRAICESCFQKMYSKQC